MSEQFLVKKSCSSRCYKFFESFVQKIVIFYHRNSKILMNYDISRLPDSILRKLSEQISSTETLSRFCNKKSLKNSKNLFKLPNKI